MDPKFYLIYSAPHFVIYLIIYILEDANSFPVLRQFVSCAGGPCHPWLFIEEAAAKEVERDFNSVYSRLVLCKTYRLDEDGKVLTPEEVSITVQNIIVHMLIETVMTCSSGNQEVHAVSILGCDHTEN
jgi:hypothetical protein